jgi:serine protease
LISVAAVSAALLAGMTTTVAAAQPSTATVTGKVAVTPAAQTAAQAVAAPAERLIVGYKSDAAEATSNAAASADAETKGKVTGNAPSALQVGVDITHTYRGDLVLDLVAPDGSAYRLKSSSTSDSADNVNTTYTVDASSDTANGTWKLRVQDVAASDTGKLNSWKLTL